jgi:energy-coupling factor transport system ATP-binding protein
VIVLDQVRFAYRDGAAEAVAGVSLSVADGERVALLGRNGSGKSTLARLLNGLHRATSGSVRVDGLDPADLEQAPAVRRSLQLVFQNPENQQVGSTVFDDIAFGLANVGVPTADMVGRARAALADVGLDVALDREVETLSGGELQRLALASVTALRPTHLVLDEVTSMLDPSSRRQVLHAVERLRDRFAMTVVQITHDLEEIEGADRVVVLDAGEVVAEGTVADVLSDAALLDAAGLEAPYRWRQPRPAAARPEPTGRTAPAAVEVVDVSHDYGARPPSRWRRWRESDELPDPVLRRVGLSLFPGELVALTGRSGAGKSTLVAVAKGLLRPSRGAVRVAGEDPWLARQPELFDPIGYLFQQPEHQLFASSVRADVGFGLRVTAMTETERCRRVDEALRRVGIDPDALGERSPFELSGGQQRRVAFAGVLVTDPSVLILDEPSAGLDRPSRDALFEILHEARSEGLAVLWISHRLDEILEHAQRVVALDRGEIVADGRPADVLSDRGVREAMGWPLLPELDPAVVEGGSRAMHEAARTEEVA